MTYSSSILRLPSLSTTIHDAGVHTIGSMPSQLEQCVRHALILLLCQFYKYGGFRISPVLKPTDYIECIHWIQQHRCVSICEPIKSALHLHNLIQKPASASLSAHTSVTIWNKKLNKASKELRLKTNLLVFAHICSSSGPGLTQSESVCLSSIGHNFPETSATKFFCPLQFHLLRGHFFQAAGTQDITVTLATTVAIRVTTSSAMATLSR